MTVDKALSVSYNSGRRGLCGRMEVDGELFLGSGKLFC